jgi:hypothetical protein
MEAIQSSEMLVHTKTTWRHIPENGILISISVCEFTAHFFSQIQVPETYFVTINDP